MTANQINYWRLSEDKRHNIVSEGETFRHNVTAEKETERSNRAREKENYRSNTTREIETERSNRAREMENYRSNTARELETHRSNVANENIKMNTLFETIRSNKVREEETRNHNLATEAANVESNRIAAQQADLASTKYNDVRNATIAKANVDVALAKKDYELKQAQTRDAIASSVAKETSAAKNWSGVVSDLSHAIFGSKGIVPGMTNAFNVIPGIK